MNYSKQLLKEQFTQNWKFCHLFNMKLFQTFMSLFHLLNTK